MTTQALSAPSKERFRRWLRSAAVEEARRPAVTLAFAQSVNGTMTRVQGTPTQLSSYESSRWTHDLRGIHDGIVVGVETVLSDNPRLTCRNGSDPSPLPIVFDSALRTPRDSALLREHSRVVVVTKSELVMEGRRRYPENVSFIAVSSRERSIEEALESARHRYGLASLMVEGGAALLHSFIVKGSFDLLSISVTARFLSGYQLGGDSLDRAFTINESYLLGGDLLILGRRGEHHESDR